MKRTSLTPRIILAVTPLTLAMVAGVASAAQPSHRPLADADGYPLVGNLIRKGETKPAPTPTPTPTPRISWRSRTSARAWRSTPTAT